MKNTHTLMILLSLSMLISCTSQKPEAAKGIAGTKNKLARIEGAMAFEFAKTMDPIREIVPRNELYEVWRTLNTTNKSGARAASETNFNWEGRGPSDVGGRTRTVLFDRQDVTNNTVWAGSVSGGLWISKDFQSANSSWQQVNDFFGNLAVTALIQDPNDPQVLYFGTGEGWFNEDAVRGFGIWKSMDGGTTWEPLISTQNDTFLYVLDLLIDQNGHLYAATRIGGVQKSEDGGSTWQQVLGISVGNADSDRGADLELGSDGDIYATFGFFSIGTVYKSDYGVAGTNAGNASTWTDITPEGDFQRIELATAPSDSNRVYLLCEGLEGGDVNDIFVSHTGGETWDSLPVPQIIDRGLFPLFTRGQAWYDLIATVSPDDPDLVFIAAVDALRSFDGGQNWEQITSWDLTQADSFSADQLAHADYHSIIFEPGSSSRAIFGTDGGLYFGRDLDQSGAKPVFSDKNAGYQTTQFYSCTISPLEGTKTVMGGTQDNGTLALWSNTSPSLGSQMFDADGGFAFFDPLDMNTLILSRSNIDLAITGDFGVNYDFISLKGGRFVNPMDYDPTARVLYGAHNEDGYFFIDSVGQSNQVDSIKVPEFNQGLPSALKVDPHLDHRLWVGLSRYWDPDRAMYFGGPAMVMLDSANSKNPVVREIALPAMPDASYLSSIDVDPNDPQHLLIAFSNYGIESIWDSRDAGTTWQSIQGDLPDFPVRWAVINPLNGQQAFLATEMGVWSTLEIDARSRSATQWIQDNEGLANVRCDMIRYRASDHMFVVATHGRGLYTSALIQDTMTTSNQELLSSQILPIYPNPVEDQFFIPTDFVTAHNAGVSVYDPLGREIFRQRTDIAPGQTIEVTLPASARSGIYFVVLKSEKVLLRSEKIWVR